MQRTDSSWTKRQSFIVIFLFSLFFSNLIEAQTISIDSIEIEGNNRTRDYIILRELSFDPDQGIDRNLQEEILERTRENILKLGIFNEANLSVEEGHINILKIEVQESWYIFPSPIFELADRNFNVWWQEQGRSLERTNYGMRMKYVNFTGNNDPIEALVQFGYTKKFEFKYDIPFLNKAKTWGLGFNIFYSLNKETSINTFDNKLIFRKNEIDNMLKRFRVHAKFKYRPNLYVFHEFKLEYQNNSIEDSTALFFNPDYFLDGKTKQEYFLASYDFRYDELDSRVYPMEGFLIAAKFEKRGFGIFNDINSLTMRLSLQKLFPINGSLSIQSDVRGRVAFLRQKQPYYNSRGLGFDPDYIRGYELYVHDALDYGFTKLMVHQKFLDTQIDFTQILPIAQISKIPLRLFISANFDVGYVNNPYYRENNSLSNKWLYGFGPSLDIVLYNNSAIKIEYSINDLGEKGIFLHNKLSF